MIFCAVTVELERPNLRHFKSGPNVFTTFKTYETVKIVSQNLQVKKPEIAIKLPLLISKISKTKIKTLFFSILMLKWAAKEQDTSVKTSD